MLGWLFGKKEEPVKVSLSQVTELLGRRRWEFESVQGRNVVKVKGKYINHHEQFDRLYLHLVGDKVQLKDGRDRLLTHIESTVSVKNLFPALKDVLNVL